MPETGNRLPNFVHLDGSGFHFDIPPHNFTAGPLDDLFPPDHRGGIYFPSTIASTIYGRNGNDDVVAAEYNGWSSWLNKPQIDYRFAALSDTNALANLFPNVEDPYMFTEYVMEGFGAESCFEDAKKIQSGITKPPLVDPNTCFRELSEGNIGFARFEYELEQIPTEIPYEFQTKYEPEHEWISSKTGRKFWESELSEINWKEQLRDGETNSVFTKTSETRSVPGYAVPVVNSGVKLYRERVWSHSIRWGQSQNIPERTITNLAPPDWFKPDSIFTGRIVPNISVITGTPIYDNSQSVGGQGHAVYDGEFLGIISRDEPERLGLRGVVPRGTNGPPDSLFTYEIDTNIDSASQINYIGEWSLENSPLYRWSSQGGPNSYSTGSLVHRGCAFWQGTGGTARCEYFAQNQSRLRPRSETIVSYPDHTSPSYIVNVPQYLPSIEKIEVSFRYQSGDWIGSEDARRAIEPIFVAGESNVQRIKIGQLSGTPEIFDEIRFRVVPIRVPVTHSTLCATYVESEDPRAGYREAGGRCPFYTPQGPQVMASFEGVSSNGAEWANQRRGLPPGFRQHPHDTARGQAALDIAAGAASIPSGGFGIGFGLAVQSLTSIRTPDPFPSGVDPQEQQTITVTYESEFVPITGKAIFYDTFDGLPRLNSNNPDADLRIKPGTGDNLLDLKSNEPFSGVDTVMFGFVNQINYRVNSNIMNCYVSSRCDSIITGVNGSQDWIRNRYSNIDFTNHELKMPGAVGHDGTDSECHYGNSNCPYNNLDRRALEYDRNYRVLINEILRPFAASGISAFGQLREAFLVDGVVRFISQDEFPEYIDNLCVAVARDTGDGIPQIGHWQKVVQDELGESWRIYFYYTTPSWDPSHKNSMVASYIVQFDNDDLPVFMENGDPWLVPIDRDYKTPNGNPSIATNKIPFAGGSHPEYKDHSHRGKEILDFFGSESSGSGAQGRSASNQFGGPRWNRAPVSRPAKIGYWTDSDGEWHLPKHPIPNGGLDFDGTAESLYIGVNDRIQNVPRHFGEYIPIDGVPGITIEDTTNPAANRKSTFARVGTTYSGDTREIIEWFNAIRVGATDVNGREHTNWWWELEPRDEDNNPIPDTAEPNPYIDGLPKERIFYKCSVTNRTFSEENVNYFLDPPLFDEPLYGPPPEGSPPNAVCVSPYDETGYLYRVERMDEFVDSRATGWADAWSPPGATVRHDGFFWKMPTLISRADKDQIQQKLGTHNDRGGSYTLDHLTPDLENWGSLPIGDTRTYSTGLIQQFVIPWAHEGDTIAQIRSEFKTIFGLIESDLVKLQNKSGNRYIEREEEADLEIQNGDTIIFLRRNLQRETPVGLPIGVGENLPESVVDELNLSDLSLPSRQDYLDGPEGDRIFNRDFQLWRISAVPGTFETIQSSNNPGAIKNALADQLESKGISRSQGNELNPRTGEILEVEERLVNPYSEAQGGGLKLLSIADIKRLRNQILPTLAYTLNNDNQGSRDKRNTANNDFFGISQLSDDRRFERTKKAMPYPVPGVIPPQVLAATSTGKDYYVQWETGDPDGGMARKDYPVGTTWWRVNQKIGAIARSGGTNGLHLDADPTTVSESRAAIEPYSDYTGDKIRSVCAYYLHGNIPMDKEVVKAYVVYRTENGPNDNPIGCQGQFDGFIAPVRASGPSFADAEYQGGAECFWQHYHPWTMGDAHEAHAGSFNNIVIGGLGAFRNRGYHGVASREHVELFHGRDEYTTNLEGGGERIFTSTERGNFTRSEQPLSLGIGVDFFRWHEGSREAYYANLGPLQINYVDDGYGWNTFQPFFRNWMWGNDLISNMTEEEIWKTISYDQYETLINRYSANVEASVNTIEKKQSFTYLAEIFRNNIKPFEHQAIPGLINFSSYDSSGNISRTIEIDRPDGTQELFDSPQIIVQNERDIPGGPEGSGTYNAGDTDRVLDITDVLKSDYNDRVNRSYRCLLGWRYSELFDRTVEQTISNISSEPPEHWDIFYPPQHFWNYRYFKRGSGMWLTDPHHHPALLADRPVNANRNGDPIEQSEEDKLARIQQVTGWDEQGLAFNDENYYQYHPRSLILAEPEFDEQSFSSVMPEPVSDPTRYWRVQSNVPSSVFFEMDLRQNPYMIMDRPYRTRAPQVDSSNAVCPNVNGCFVADRGWTVGQFFEAATSTFGFQTIPSTGSSTCANCRTFLGNEPGYLVVPGDGIRTVEYDRPFEEDAILSAIEVSQLPTEDWYADRSHGYVIEYYNSKIDAWQFLFQVEYDSVTNRYSWREWDGSEWSETQGSTPPTNLTGCEGSRGLPKDRSASAGCHFISVSASKIRYRVVDPARIDISEPQDGFGVCQIQDNTVLIEEQLTEPISTYTNRELTLRDSETQNTVTVFIIDAEETDQGTRIRISGEAIPTANEYQINWTTYIARCSVFRVFGYNHNSDQVTITPPSFLQPLFFSPGVNEIGLNIRPTQIFSVSCRVGEGRYVNMERAEDPSSSDFAWTVKTSNRNGIDFLEIEKGQWSYDHISNKIVLPTSYTQDGMRRSIWTINRVLYDNATLDIQTEPTQILVDYFTGIGTPVDVRVEAAGKGPSYQLDRECVSFIHNNGPGRDLPPPDGVLSEELPQMGLSERLTGFNNGQRFPLEWQVYNHNPLIWDAEIDWIVGDELPAGGWNDNAIHDFMTGGRGSNYHDLGRNSKINGVVNGQVTLYGTPNTILSGDLAVFARDYTERSYTAGNGETYQTRERTGGYRKGSIIFGLDITNTGRGRRSICGSVPTVLVYLKERDLDDEL